ncbi:hypothetical protein LCGC14_2066340 [marine sediment metagenome]|uniref:Uncharacterized protein n=1 Tax=marine sediment metagenome TaxID=412755 RepID=A0A0F9HGS0_9ZZZZ
MILSSSPIKQLSTHALILLPSLLLNSFAVKAEVAVDLPKVEVTSGSLSADSYIPLVKQPKVG